MRILKPERSLFFNPQVREILNREADKRAVEELTSEKPMERVEAVERLLEVVNDDKLKKELTIIVTVAKKEEFLKKIEKEEAKVDNMTKEKAAKYEKLISGYTAAKTKSAEDIENLAMQRTMSDSELQQKLKKVLA
ncbi:MAG: hypothetical protein Sv326_0901 [Candidatus Fermentimicrarchaeum limneticum]|uniref:Uncharacterized protein n=1 Tax=Fermentimicrarchaeum limneticum TaxID=2795018 RepID=A0A7D6BLR8_FERL1|nr:MAG: hypothetical protein Sv326_0901 [Candidatus Fermentimicrarchaeum limneticum]